MSKYLGAFVFTLLFCVQSSHAEYIFEGTDYRYNPESETFYIPAFGWLPTDTALDILSNYSDVEEDIPLPNSGTSGVEPLSVDSDGDGLANVLEIEFGTDPNNIDSDFDGFNDLDELLYYWTDPMLHDDTISEEQWAVIVIMIGFAESISANKPSDENLVPNGNLINPGPVPFQD